MKGCESISALQIIPERDQDSLQLNWPSFPYDDETENKARKWCPHVFNENRCIYFCSCIMFI